MSAYFKVESGAPLLCFSSSDAENPYLAGTLSFVLANRLDYPMVFQYISPERAWIDKGAAAVGLLFNSKSNVIQPRLY